jgi:hypothetical protein
VRKAILGAGLLALVTLPLGSAAAGQSSSKITPDGAGCNVVFQSGSGTTLNRYCISTGGNVEQFQFSTNADVLFESLIAEGYGVCHATASYYDYESGSPTGWNAGTTTGTANNLTVSRISTDGLVKLSQNFTPIGTGGVKIKMTVTNLSSTVTLTSLRVARFGNLDLTNDGSWTNDFGISSADAATEYESIGTYGATLEAQTYPTPHSMALASSLAPVGCTPGAAPAQPGDLGVFGIYTIGTLKPGKAKTVTFSYNRY